MAKRTLKNNTALAFEASYEKLLEIISSGEAEKLDDVLELMGVLPTKLEGDRDDFCLLAQVLEHLTITNGSGVSESVKEIFLNRLSACLDTKKVALYLLSLPSFNGVVAQPSDKTMKAISSDHPTKKMLENFSEMEVFEFNGVLAYIAGFREWKNPEWNKPIVQYAMDNTSLQFGSLCYLIASDLSAKLSTPQHNLYFVI